MLPLVDDRFGNCPTCHKTNGFLNVGRDHWFVCDRHRSKWWVGSNLFSCWRDQDEQGRLVNVHKLAGYREVKPWFPDVDGQVIENPAPVDQMADCGDVPF